MRKRTPTIDEVISAPAAAAAKGVTKEAVYAAISTGRLKAVKFCGRFMIRAADLDEWEIVGHRPKKRREDGGESG